MGAPTDPAEAVSRPPLDDAYDPVKIICMRTTLDLDETLLDAAARATGASTKTALIELGLRALIEQAARRRLAERRGTVTDAVGPRRRRPRP